MSGEVLVVTGEALWPAVHGGRIRAARIVEELALHFPVTVVAPVESDPPGGIEVRALQPPPAARPPVLAAGGGPGLGHALLGPERLQTVRQVIANLRPRAVVFTHGYLAAMLPEATGRAVVDFQDIECRRMAALSGTGRLRSRAAFGWEGLKARRWEPRLARRAMLVTASLPADVERLRGWGASALHVPNGAPRLDPVASPAGGPVTLIASFGYSPNLEAARFVLDRVWPRLRRAAPDLRLRIVGRQAAARLGGTATGDGVEVVSDPVSVDPYYAEASVVLAPVRRGGGAQLKVTEALARGRTLVATPHSAESVPAPARPAVLVAAGASAFAARVLEAWQDVPGRHARERLLDPTAVPTWADACAPLFGALSKLVDAR